MSSTDRYDETISTVPDSAPTGDTASTSGERATPPWQRLGLRIGGSRLTSGPGILVVLLVVLCAYFYSRNEVFLTTVNLQNIARQTSVLAMLAAGQLFVVLIGGLDISVGAQVSLIAISAVMLSSQVPLPIAMVIAILIGALVGLVNGLLVTRFRLSPIIATLATWQVILGSLLVWTSGESSRNFSKEYNFLGGQNIGPLPVAAIVAAIVLLLASFLLRRTSFGRYTYAIGGNAEAARLSGIKVGLVTVGAYVVCSVFTAMGALTLSSQVGSGVANLGIGLEVTTLAAVFIGGAAWGGGAGTVSGVLLGSLLLGVLGNGFDLIAVSSDIQTIVTGILIAVSVALAGRRGKVASSA